MARQESPLVTRHCERQLKPARGRERREAPDCEVLALGPVRSIPGLRHPMRRNDCARARVQQAELRAREIPRLLQAPRAQIGRGSFPDSYERETSSRAAPVARIRSLTETLLAVVVVLQPRQNRLGSVRSDEISSRAARPTVLRRAAGDLLTPVGVVPAALGRHHAPPGLRRPHGEAERLRMRRDLVGVEVGPVEPGDETDDLLGGKRLPRRRRSGHPKGSGNTRRRRRRPRPCRS